MHQITKVLSGIGILIAIYLVLSQGSATTKLITGVLDGSANMIKTLQGRG